MNATPGFDEYKETVEQLYEDGETNVTGGVSAIVVATELDVPVQNAFYYLDGLVQNGELDDVYDFPGEKGGPYRRGFVPSKDS